MGPRPLRVAFDARSLAYPVLRGWDRYTVGLIKELVRQGVEVTLFHREREPLHALHLIDVGCEVIGLKDRSGLHWEQVAVPLTLKRRRYDVLHAPAERGVPLIAPCPVVLTIHSVTTDSYADLINRGLLRGSLRDYLGYETKSWDFWASYLRAQFKRADHIFSPSDFCREEVMKFLGIAPEKVTTTPLAVHDQFKQTAKSESERAATLQRLGVRKPYLLNVGGYEPHKNVGGLLALFALVRQREATLSLVIVGSKSIPEEIRTHAERLDLHPGRDVVFLANITDDLTNLYDEAELFVTLSWRETFCLPLLEAITRGVPAIASSWGASREVIGDVGGLVDPRDTVAASQAILELLMTKEKDSLKQRAIEQAQRFSWEQTAKQTLWTYQELITNR